MFLPKRCWQLFPDTEIITKKPPCPPFSWAIHDATLIKRIIKIFNYVLTFKHMIILSIKRNMENIIQLLTLIHPEKWNSPAMPCILENKEMEGQVHSSPVAPLPIPKYPTALLHSHMKSKDPLWIFDVNLYIMASARMNCRPVTSLAHPLCHESFLQYF